jgi:hypothetical protein
VEIIVELMMITFFREGENFLIELG